jgi:hypothetical protein
MSPGWGRGQQDVARSKQRKGLVHQRRIAGDPSQGQCRTNKDVHAVSGSGWPAQHSVELLDVADEKPVSTACAVRPGDEDAQLVVLGEGLGHSSAIPRVGGREGVDHVVILRQCMTACRGLAGHDAPPLVHGSVVGWQMMGQGVGVELGS